MPLDLMPGDRAAFNTIVAQLEAAWKAGDGTGFAAPFADDADFVNIRGEHHRGKQAIAAGHTQIFQTIYAGSTIQCTVESARLLHADVGLVHVVSNLDVPRGPLAGRHVACFSMVVTKNGDSWQIVAFHNTLRAGPPPTR